MADHFPSLLIKIIQSYLEEGTQTIEFLTIQHSIQMAHLTSSLSTAGADPLHNWMLLATSRASELSQGGAMILHHCSVMKVMKCLLAAWTDKDDEAKLILRAL